MYRTNTYNVCVVWVMIQFFLKITWGALQRLPLIIVPFFIAGVLIYRRVKILHRASFLTGIKFRHLITKNSTILSNIKVALYVMGLFFFIIALFKPMWDKKEETMMQEGRDLFIALDVSRSMLAQDCLPDRLTCAKQKIKQLVQSLESQRVALILFSGSAFVQCPLTSDYGAFFMFLDQVDVETISSGTTAIDQALKITLETIKTMAPKKHKLLALFTDGEDFSTHLSALKQNVIKENLKLFTFGVGSEQGAPIPLYDQRGVMIGHQKDVQSKIVISRLNNTLLESLAFDAGGVYIKMTENSDDIAHVTKTLNSLEKEAIEEKKVSHVQDRYYYPLFMSFFCLMVEWIV